LHIILYFSSSIQELTSDREITVKCTTLVYLTVTIKLNSKEVFIDIAEEHSLRLTNAMQNSTATSYTMVLL